MRLKDKIAIVTGAAQGIGEAIARAFVQEGACVLICDKLAEKAEETMLAIKLSTPHAQLACCGCDIGCVEDVQTMVCLCTETLGQPNVLVNNAGKNFFHAPLDTTDDIWRKCIDNDLTGAWNCAREVLRYMVKNKDGAIINIASVHGHKIIPTCFPYPVAKHGIIGLTKALGVEYAAHNVRVNSISPGLIETPMTVQWYKAAVAQGLAEDVESFRTQQADILPCKRIGNPHEVAKLAVLLASDEAPFINATDILIDGGRSALYHE